MSCSSLDQSCERGREQSLQCRYPGEQCVEVVTLRSMESKCSPAGRSSSRAPRAPGLSKRQLPCPFSHTYTHLFFLLVGFFLEIPQMHEVLCIIWAPFIIQQRENGKYNPLTRGEVSLKNKRPLKKRGEGYPKAANLQPAPYHNLTSAPCSELEG